MAHMIEQAIEIINPYLAANFFTNMNNVFRIMAAKATKARISVRTP